MNATRSGRQIGFTLVETLVAIAVASLVLAAVLEVTRLFLPSASGDGGTSAASTRALALSDLLGRDLAALARLPNGRSGFVVQRSEGGTVMEFWRGTVASGDPAVDEGAPRLALQRVRYATRRESNGTFSLWRRAAEPVGVTTRETGAVPVLRGLQSFAVACTDGARWADQWTVAGTPQQLRVTLVFGGRESSALPVELLFTPLPSGGT